MRKWVNTIFFGSCFITAILMEVYSIQVWEGKPIPTIALGVVVLITGYLFMDSIRSKVEKSSKEAKFYMDHLLNDVTEKWTERYTEMLNLQKASYTATKKNSVMVSEQFGEILLRLEALENGNADALHKIIELQKKSMEGQKNALNLGINYNKENTKKIIGLLRAEEKKNDLSDQITRMIDLLERNNELIREQRNHMTTVEKEITAVYPPKQEQGFGEKFLKASDLEEYSEDFHDQLQTVDHIEEEITAEENASEADWSFTEEPELEAINPIVETEKPKVIPLYDDPNKALTADEIAAMFASFGK